MVDIIGGTYWEYCAFPHHHGIFGSGLRAALAISEFSKKIQFHTCVGKSDTDSVKAILKSRNIAANINTIETTIEFDYLHCMSKPSVHFGDNKYKPTIAVEASNILVYGMIDANSVVKGRRVVYDPQSPESPEQFLNNGSSASELAIIINEKESKLLSGEDSPHTAACKIMNINSANVVIVKLGAAGAFVKTKFNQANIPCYKTESTWTIGSGDIFSSVFAHLWCEEMLDPITCAHKSSRATAYYCSSRSLPLPYEFEQLTSDFVSINNKSGNDNLSDIKVYLAGPFFTVEQRWLIEEIRQILMRLGLAVFSPVHDVGFGDDIKIATEDLSALSKCNIVFAVTDGLDPGTLFEVGYAISLNIPVVALAQRVIEEDLKMLRGTGCLIVKDITSSIYHTIWKAFEL